MKQKGADCIFRNFVEAEKFYNEAIGVKFGRNLYVHIINILPVPFNIVKRKQKAWWKQNTIKHEPTTQAIWRNSILFIAQ